MPYDMVDVVGTCDAAILDCVTFQKTLVLKFTTENSYISYRKEQKF
jgi:hypothetical protein